MDRRELNRIIKENHKNAVPVSELCFPDVEELYVDSQYGIVGIKEFGGGLEKADLAAFWVRFDYQGIRNALEILRNSELFKDSILKNLINGRKTRVSPSQLTYLRLLTWDVERLSIDIGSSPWVKPWSVLDY